MKTDYYVYSHKDLDGVVFYIGKGRGRRCLDKNMRSKQWNDVALSGFTHEILAEGLDEVSALELESSLIGSPKEDWKLVNVHKPVNGYKCLEDAFNLFAYSELSPSGLIYAEDVYGGTGYCKLQVPKGSPAGSLSKEGYWKVKTKTGLISAHRVVYALFNRDQNIHRKIINHIDNNPSNNMIDNLELVDTAINARRKSNNNGKPRSDNATGVNGVSFSVDRKGRGRFTGTVVLIDGRISTRSFSVLKYGKDEAFRLACEWRQQMIAELNAQGAGYTERHGT